MITLGWERGGGGGRSWWKQQKNLSSLTEASFGFQSIEGFAEDGTCEIDLN